MFLIDSKLMPKMHLRKPGFTYRADHLKNAKIQETRDISIRIN